MIIKKLFGSRNDRLIKKIRKIVVKINSLESEFQKLSDIALKAKTQEFKKRLTKRETLIELLPEAFASVREASRRIRNERHYDVQLIGGITLNLGKIAEMKTGEGKTLVATLPAYLNALTGHGVHVITVNDYLAIRDAQAMGEIYNFLELTTGVVVSHSSPEERKAAYNCDITYGTNNEFGFDYLRDNMAFNLGEQVQRSRNFVIIDEIDSILIDEARTPLIISGAAEDSSEMYLLFNELVPKLVKQGSEKLKDGDFYIDEKSKQAYLTEKGHRKTEQMLMQKGVLSREDNLYSKQHVTKMHYLNTCLRAHNLYYLNVDYIIHNQEVIIIDENTGRAMHGRRWSDGLHQAIEAKENVKIQSENQTLASITFQNFFKLYNKISGMTGTADTEAFEFYDIYNLEVLVIPTNRPSQRQDSHDRIFGEQKEKLIAIVQEIKNRIIKHQPVLVGTASIETSEVLSDLLKKQKIKHEVLNAKQHKHEAIVIEQAGFPGNVTIATNMAGRGTDIVLGGNLEAELRRLENPTKEKIIKIKKTWEQRHQQVIEAGGLCVLGSERHDSRRIDNQLRGRSGRQGDPGKSCFYLSMDDNLLRVFASESLVKRMKNALSGGESIQFGMMTQFIAKAQKKVEQYHYNVRKNLLEYDNVANEQRIVIYKQRQELLNVKNVSKVISNMCNDVTEKLLRDNLSDKSIKKQYDFRELEEILSSDFSITINIQKILNEDLQFSTDKLKLMIVNEITYKYQETVNILEQTVIDQFEKVTLIKSLDNHWREHLNSMDHLRNSVNLRGYAQKDPKNEYKKESFQLFAKMLDNFKYEVITSLTQIRISTAEEAKKMEKIWRNSFKNLEEQHNNLLLLDNNESYKHIVNDKHRTFIRGGPKIRRNNPCHCGSKKKYKHCHGAFLD